MLFDWSIVFSPPSLVIPPVSYNRLRAAVFSQTHILKEHFKTVRGSLPLLFFSVVFSSPFRVPVLLLRSLQPQFRRTPHFRTVFFSKIRQFSPVVVFSVVFSSLCCCWGHSSHSFAVLLIFEQIVRKFDNSLCCCRVPLQPQLLIVFVVIVAAAFANSRPHFFPFLLGWLMQRPPRPCRRRSRPQSPPR